MIMILKTILCTALLILHSCAFTQENKSPSEFSVLTPISADYTHCENDVLMMVKTLNQNDCAKLFGEKADALTAGNNGLCPIRISLSNNSKHDVKINKKSIKIPLASSSEVRDKLCPEYSEKCTWGICLITLGPIVGIIAAVTIVLIPIFALGIASVGGVFIACCGAAFLAGSLMITPICAGIYELSDISRLDTVQQEVKTKINYEAILKPGESKEMLIFVKKRKFKNKFVITAKQEALLRFDVSVKNPDYFLCD